MCIRDRYMGGLTNISIALQGLMTKYHTMVNKDADKNYDIFLPGESEFLGKRVTDSVIVNDDPKLVNLKEAVIKREIEYLRSYLDFQEKKLEKMRNLANDLGNLVGDDAQGNNPAGSADPMIRYTNDEDNIFGMPQRSYGT
eukprot:TRINITY_DN6342_c0_g1_i5.p2 TRINITY_DN6342_c0_g1~~TRINITY_DN6342_c0_g1_i5.p2  ORF type:complete len:141 (+),score=33.48 TRINITY_DN6342_c0_g1_i5:64-486(+)